MIVTRATDASFINWVMNHPEVRRHLPGKPGRVDVSAAVTNPNNVTLTGQYGGMICVQVVTGVWELHTQVVPEGRGAWALDMARECAAYLFLRTNATEVYTRVPQGNVAAMALARACGARPENPPQVQDIAGEMCALQIYAGRLQDWLNSASAAPMLEELGRAFHVKLGQKKAARGLDLPGHPDNRWHDIHVGAAYGMIEAGQTVKGILVYNRWAALAMAPPMRVVSSDPLILDITECRLEVRDGDFEVIPVTEH